MADYSKATNFSVKDTLSTGDPNKIVSGAEIDTEFDNIAVASGTKADKVSGATSGNVAQLDTNGNLVDSGYSSNSLLDNVVTTEGDIVLGGGSGSVARLGIGSSGLTLVSNGTTASWGQIGAGGIANNAVTNDKVTGLGAENFQTGATEVDWVRNRITSMGVGTVGSYGLMKIVSQSSNESPGGVIAGSSLQFANADGSGATGSPSGTWRAMGFAFGTSTGSGGGDQVSLFLRIS